MSQKIRKAFLTSLYGDVYIVLRRLSFFSEWDARELYRMASAIVNDNQGEIFAFLDERNFSLTEVDNAKKIVLNQILIPKLQNIKL